MKVLLAIDGSPHSTAAVAAVAGRPWPTHTAVHILTVIHPLIPMLPEPTLVIVASSAQDAEEQRQRAPLLLDLATRQIERAAPRVAVTTGILEGVPAAVIVEEARAWDADLIVVGSHGYGFVKRLLLGSVARAVVANAPCSVEVVRLKTEGHQSDSPAGWRGDGARVGPTEFV